MNLECDFSVVYDSETSFSFQKTLYPGELFHLQKANGGGKTTIMNALSGCVKATKGYARFCNQDILLKPIQQRPISYMQQEAIYFPGLTVAKTFALAKICPSTALEALAEFSLESLWTSPITSLSGGQRQLVLLLQTLLLHRDIVLLDEPFSNLDPEKRDKAYVYTKNFIQKNRYIGLLSHHGHMEESIAMS